MFLEQESKRAGGCCKNAAIQVHEKQLTKRKDTSGATELGFRGSAPQFVERREAKYSPRGFVRWSIVSFVRSRAESADKMNRKFIRAE